jgi:L-fuculose-phosphate aldolase
MAAAGLVTGSSGNVSRRVKDRILITPSGVAYRELTPKRILEIDEEGHRRSGAGAPSSEWRMHAAVYAARPDVRAIVHTHSVHATAAACHLTELPIAHDEGRLLLGRAIPMSRHAPPGTQDLADAVAAALGEGPAALIARHGAIGVGSTLDEALEISIKIEETAHLFILGRALDARE